MKKYRMAVFALLTTFCMGMLSACSFKFGTTTPRAMLYSLERERISYFLIYNTWDENFGIGMRFDEKDSILVLFKNTYWKINPLQRQARKLSAPEELAVAEKTKDFFILEKADPYDIFINIDKFFATHASFILIDDDHDGYYFDQQTEDIVDLNSFNSKFCSLFGRPTGFLTISAQSWDFKVIEDKIHDMENGLAGKRRKDK